MPEQGEAPPVWPLSPAAPTSAEPLSMTFSPHQPPHTVSLLPCHLPLAWKVSTTPPVFTSTPMLCSAQKTAQRRVNHWLACKRECTRVDDSSQQWILGLVPAWSTGSGAHLARPVWQRVPLPQLVEHVCCVEPRVVAQLARDHFECLRHSGQYK